MGLWTFLISYLLGGFTFIPLVVIAVAFFSYWYLPDVGIKPDDEQQVFAADDDKQLKSDDEIASIEEEDSGVNVYTTAWVTVSRKYFIYPNGGPKDALNPPEQAANDASIGKSESAYSSLYKLMSNNGSKLLNRTSSSSTSSESNSMVSDGENKSTLSPSSSPPTPVPLGNASPTTSPTTSSTKSSTTTSKSKLHKYFAVLKHGNILLYADSEEVKVKHVIVLANHIVMLWPPSVPDGELFIKRSAICLAKRDSYDGFNSLFSNPHSPPRDAFYLYLDNCSDKEDFYHALIRASKRKNSTGWDSNLEHGVDLNPSILATPLSVTTNQIMDLIVNLHASDTNIHSRWFNALLGRLFLNLKDTQLFEERIKRRIVYKLSRVKRPNFLGDIKVNKIHTGTAIPYFTNMKLKELTPEGLFVMETNVNYSGNFSVEIATKAIINLGSRFKTRDVSVVLAVTLKNLEGKLNLKIKPPPSNRIWYSFETMPKLNLLIEPVVSSKQITYSMVTKAIENRIRELFKEGLVTPNWDDIAFFNTKDMFYRGGIWNTKDRPQSHRLDALSLSKLQENSSSHEAGLPYPNASSNIIAESIHSELKRNTSTEVHETHTLRHRNTISEVNSDLLKSQDDSVDDSEIDDNTSVLPSEDVRRARPRSSSRTISNNNGDAASPSRQKADNHIGELQGFGYTPNSNNSSSSANGNLNVQGAKALVGSVKKWGSWYFKEKMAKKDRSSSPSSLSARSEEHVSSSENMTHAKQAPLPHEFPPELMHTLSDPNPITNPYAPPPEMKLPVRYPSPSRVNESSSTHGKPTHQVKRRPVGLSSNSKQEAEVITEDPSHRQGGPLRDQKITLHEEHGIETKISYRDNSTSDVISDRVDRANKLANDLFNNDSTDEKIDKEPDSNLETANGSNTTAKVKALVEKIDDNKMFVAETEATVEMPKSTDKNTIPADMDIPVEQPNNDGNGSPSCDNIDIANNKASNGDNSDCYSGCGSSSSRQSSFHPSPVFELQSSPSLGDKGLRDDSSINSYSLNSSVSPIQMPQTQSTDERQLESSATSGSSHSSISSSENSVQSRRVSVVALGSENGRQGIVLHSSPPKVAISATSTAASHLTNNSRRYQVKRKQVGSGSQGSVLPLSPVPTSVSQQATINNDETNDDDDKAFSVHYGDK